MIPMYIINYDYTDCMDYMDPDVHGPQNAVKHKMICMRDLACTFILIKFIYIYIAVLI